MENLGVIEIDLGEGPIQINLDQYVPIQEETMTLEYAQHSTKYAYLAMICARAEAMYISAKNSADKMEKQGIIDAKSMGKITDEVAKAMAEVSVSELREWEIYCRSQYILLRSIVDAMTHRKDMLISLGAHMRSERDSSGMTLNNDIDTGEVISMLNRVRAAKSGR